MVKPKSEAKAKDTAVAVRSQSLKHFKPEAAKNAVAREKFKKHKQKLAEGIQKTRDAEILNTEVAGFLETDDGTHTFNVKQAEIRDAVDLATGTRSFSLDLEHGPYRFDFGINGRELIIGGKKGHVGVFDWMTKDLIMEKDVLESVNDVSFLHVSTLSAVAQRRWVHIYDEQGIELHCMKKFNEPKLLEFLPRHLLLVCTTATGYIHYLDISTGEIVTSYRMKDESNPLGLAKNITNGIIVTGGSSGQVCMWSPNVKESIVSIKAHTGVIRDVVVDHSGNYFSTAGTDQRIKLFDIRTYKQLSVYKYPTGTISSISLSQRNCLGVGVGQRVEVFRDVTRSGIVSPYLSHFVGGDVRQVQFCDFEDIIGIGHSKGYASLIVPGSGDPEMAGSHNPFESKTQRREREVRMLLDKIQPQLICINPSELNRVNIQKTAEAVLPPQMKVKPNHAWPLLSRFKRH